MFTNRRLADMYGVSPSTISKLLTNTTPDAQVGWYGCIKDLYEIGKHTFKQIGEMLGISESQVSRIYRGQSRHTDQVNYSKQRMYQGSNPDTQETQQAHKNPLHFSRIERHGQLKGQVDTHISDVLGFNGISSDAQGRPLSTARSRPKQKPIPKGRKGVRKQVPWQTMAHRDQLAIPKHWYKKSE